MLWFYSRNQQSLSIETRFDNVSREFVGTVTGLAGPPITKRFSTPDAFREWLLEMERDLASQQWQADGQPHVLPDGWRDAPWRL